MAKSPEDRYQNGEDIIRALNNISDDVLTKINAEFTKEGHRDSGEHVNYKVSTPISTSGVTSVRHATNANSLQGDETKIVSVTSPTVPKKSSSTPWIFALVGVVMP